MKEALKLALEALENALNKPMWDRPKMTKTITAIKEALAQPEKGLFIDLIAQHEGLADELAQPDYRAVKTYHEGKPVYVSQPEQEPVEWPCVIETADFEEDTVTLKMQTSDYKVSAGKHWLSTTPPKRPWVGLTDEEYDEIWRMDLNNKDIMDKTIAKLKEKNT